MPKKLLTSPGLEFAFGLAEKLGQANPFEMLEQMPEQVHTYWLAYRRLQDPDNREQAQWDAMDKDEFVAAQSDQIAAMLNAAGGSG